MMPGITKKVAPALDKPLRDDALYLWAWYLDISASRQVGGMGFPQAITLSDLLAWVTLQGLMLKPWELRALRLLDMHHVKALMQKDAPSKEDLSDG